MPGLDWIPIVSQLKSSVQLLTGDVEGAARTQANFCQECPVLSQAVSLGQVVVGDTDGALETQKKCLGTLNNVANGLPVVGHVKGVIHYAVGDTEGGHHAMNAASRSAVVLSSGAGAALFSGGLAAIPAGIAAGAAYDSAGSLITDKPQGLIAAIDRAIDEQKKTSKCLQSDGILSDDYAGQQLGGSCQTREAKEKKCQAYEKQKPQGSMTQTYLNIPVLTKKEIDELKREQKRNPQNQNSKSLLQDLSWLEVHMPDEFNYTGAALRNHARQGLLHSFLRHSNQWADVIPKLDEDIQNLSIGHDLDEIGSASQPKVAANLLDQFIKKNLSDDDREALSDIQMRIYNFLNRNITYSSYLGEGINNDGRMQVFFKVVDNLGNEQVMVVCVSEQLYPPNRDFVDKKRPVRTITTIYFITLEALKKIWISKTF